MTVTEGQLLAGTALEIKEVEYASTKEFVTPFLEAVKPLKERVEIRVKHANPTVINESGERQLAFTRVNIEAYIKTDKPLLAEHVEVIGLCYALDVKQPIAKIYRGYRNASGNLIIPNPALIAIQEIAEDELISVEAIENLLGNATNLLEYDKKLQTLISTTQISNDLGRWVVACADLTIKEDSYKVQLGSAYPIKAFKSLIIDQDSEYYVAGKDTYINNVLHSLLNIVTNDDKDIITEFEKTVLINRMLGL